MEKPKILVGFEYSGIVRDAFLERGFDAWSCDIEPTESKPERHYQQDIFFALYRGNWDLVILHPPCTKVCVSGNRWYGAGMPRHDERLDDIAWTEDVWDGACGS